MAKRTIRFPTGNVLGYHRVEPEGGRALCARRDLPDDITATPAPGQTADAPGTFDEILYWIYTSTDDFDLPKFRATLPADVRQFDDAEVSAAPREGDHGMYFAFLAWHVVNDDVRLVIEYHNGPLDHAYDESEPYAEDLMRWLGQFFSTDTVTAHAHVRLRYSTATHKSKIPLALTVDPPCDAELYGVALRLRTKPSGATSVRLTRGQSHWYAEIVGERALTFDQSTPLADVAIFRDVLAMFIEEKSA